MASLLNQRLPVSKQCQIAISKTPMEGTLRKRVTTFNIKYLNVPESKFLPLMLQKYCYLPTKLVQILFFLEIVQKKTKSESNSAAISGFLCNKCYKRIISPLKGAKNAYQLRPDQWSLVLMSGETFF